MTGGHVLKKGVVVSAVFDYPLGQLSRIVLSEILSSLGMGPYSEFMSLAAGNLLQYEVGPIIVGKGIADDSKFLRLLDRNPLICSNLSSGPIVIDKAGIG